MRLGVLVLVLAAGAATASAGPADRGALARARTAYNAGRFDAAIGAARNAAEVAGDTDPARLVLGRALLERYRQSGDARDLQEARDVLRAADPGKLGPADRAELLVGLGQWLFFTDRFGPAAELFEVAAARPLTGGDAATDRVLDWWASALDRQAQATPAARDRIYGRVFERMEQRAPSRIPDRSPPTTGWSPRRARSVISTARGRPRWPRGCVRHSRATVGPRCGPISIDSCSPRSSPSVRGKRSSDGGNERQAADTMAHAWERFKADWDGAAPASALASPQESAPRR